MIIKKLKLENIRSYKKQFIDFSLGKTLFEGDIGSGKSTILMAIEFGLFGLGSEKAGSLLRAGEKDGSVGVVFESGGKEYVVSRHLVKKGNSINQDDCVLKSPDDGTKAYSVTELKEKILEVLGFNEPMDPKAQSFIYRYAIYTPQEEMKAILTLRPDIRLQTLRKAFRMEEYKTSAENTKNLSNEIKSRGKELAAMASEVLAIKAKIEQLKASTSLKKNELVDLNLELKRVNELIETQKVKRDDLRTKQLALKAETGKVDALLTLVAEKEKEIKEAQAQIASNRARIKLVQPKIAEISTLTNPSELAQKELKEMIQGLEEELKKLRNLETQIQVKFSDYKTILEKGVCPTCDQAIDPHGFSDLVTHKENELRATHENVEGFGEKLQASKVVLDKKVQFDMAQTRMEDAKKSLSEYEENVRIWQSKFEEAGNALKKASTEMISVKTSVQRLQDVNADLQNVEIRISKSEEDLKRIERSISSAEANIVDWERQTKDYEDSIERKLEKKASSDKLSEYLIWVQDYFLPTLELVEKQVMLNHNQEFNIQFQKWFGMLVDDPGKQAKVDEEFTPVIQQDGLDQEVSYLSGGEKTSVALAYRLALNSVVRKESSGLESNLLILDEPTDGFSKEQLSKVREILDEIQSPQIILVSHERELESFADQVIKVSKANGESGISVVQ
jgi:DNA repair protein SbcC/Rad50